MSKTKIRKDKTCLNCNYVVENKFCGNCSQENSETRKSFTHLFMHFFEDLTHYENAFWRTIKNLVFKPASLSKEYLSGKRMSYLAPVRLYIFVSFVTFFMISILPHHEKAKSDKELKSQLKTKNIHISNSIKNKTPLKISDDSTKTKKENRKKDTVYKDQIKILNLEKKGIISKKVSDSSQKLIIDAKKNNTIEDDGFLNLEKNYTTVKELDSIQKFGKPSEKMGWLNFWLNRKIQVVKEKYSKDELKEKFSDGFLHNLPKALFVYMPLFAFILWIFQNKKRWYYFDHGIFTLHYFSFLLLSVLIINIEDSVMSYLDEYLIFKIFNYIFKTAAFVYLFYYFFPAHHRFYGETKVISMTKGIVMFFINFISLSLILFLFVIYTLITIH